MLILRALCSGLPELIETTVLPTVGEDGTERQYVCVTLQVRPLAGYPDVQPQFQLRNPRGLDDHRIDAIRRAIQHKLGECVGQPVVFDLIEVVREQLSESNLPSGQCVICLYGFDDADAFAKTACYHYLHSYCLGRHLEATRRQYREELDKLPAWQQQQAAAYQATCPVCREPIDGDVEPLRNAEPPAGLATAPPFERTPELKQLQARMEALYVRQRQRGGIIEADAGGTSGVIAIEDGDAEELQLQLEMQRKKRAEREAAAMKVAESATAGDGCADAEADVDEAEEDWTAALNGGYHSQKVSFNRKGKQSATSNVAAANAKEPTPPHDEDEDEEANNVGSGGGRHRRQQQHHIDHHRRGGNRHNRRRQFHSSHSAAANASTSAAAAENGNGAGANR